MVVTLLMLSVLMLILKTNSTLSQNLTLEEIENEVEKEISGKCTFLTFGQHKVHFADYYEINHTVIDIVQKKEKKTTTVQINQLSLIINITFTFHCPAKMLVAFGKTYADFGKKVVSWGDETADSTCCYGITREPYCCSSSFLNSALWIGIPLLLLLGIIGGAAYFVYRRSKSTGNIDDESVDTEM